MSAATSRPGMGQRTATAPHQATKADPGIQRPCLGKRTSRGQTRWMTSGSPQTTTGLATGWRARAACAGQHHALFFPKDDADERAIKRARQICAACAVANDCLAFALETNQRAGIWGGTTEEERRSLRRRWLATRQRAG